ncbi:MAG: efflux RND transporter periplasmic adaptor subunit [Xanthomonadales bacterium PRO7]|nr:efflux RND transporter periplasmic adaptor subunit [Xanthomonadales bacterium PRO7]
MKIDWCIGASAVLVLACMAGCASKASDAPPAATKASDVKLSAQQLQHVTLYTVADEHFHESIRTNGTVDFDNERATGVLAPMSGPVTKLLVAPGDRVQKGQALALVHSPDYAAAVDAYRKAQAAASNARRNADVDKDLLAHKGVSEREAAQAQSDAIGAEADASAALQALVALNIDPKILDAVREGRPAPQIDGVIRAPLAGTVVERLIAPGQLLQAGTTPCFTIADLSRVWVMAQLFGDDANRVSAGDTAQVDAGATTLNGTVTNVAAEVDPATRAVTARVTIDNPHGVLKKQMYVPVTIVSHKDRSGLLIPAAAILRDDENLPFVYVEQADGGFARRPVTLGYSDGEHDLVNDGLHAGDKIVAQGAIFLRFIETQ